MKKLALIGFLFLTACATVKPMYMRDGVMVYRATCNGAIRDIGDCYALASEQCGGNFEVVNSLEDKSLGLYNKNENKQTKYGYGSKSSSSDTMGMKATVVNRSLSFYCKK